MVIAATVSKSLVAVTLPATPNSVQIARFYVRAALGFHDLGDDAEDLELVTSELVSNAVTHTGARAFGLELLLLEEGPRVIAVVVTDSCPRPPVMKGLTEDAEHGRGLRVIEALSARWGWTPQDPGKAVFAIFTRQG